MKKSCIATLGAYLLSKKTNCNLFPQGVLARSDVSAVDGNCGPPAKLEPTLENIRDNPLKVRLYRKPAININQLTSMLLHECTDEDRQEPWDVGSWNKDWDGLNTIQRPSYMKDDYSRHLHLLAKEESENGERTARGADQEAANRKREQIQKGDFTYQMHNPNAVRERPDDFYKDVTGFPVNRMDPPHSDVTVPRSHDARADFWVMEHAFRKICYRHIFESEETTHSTRYDYYLSVPKNLVAYIVQRLMQFPPETFGRFRISDGSHTHVSINYNGVPHVVIIGETSHLQDEYMARNHDFDRGLADIGLDVPVATDEDHGGGRQNSPQNGHGHDEGRMNDFQDDLDNDDSYCEEEGFWDEQDEDADDDENCTSDRDDGEIRNRQFSLF